MENCIINLSHFVGILFKNIISSNCGIFSIMADVVYGTGWVLKSNKNCSGAVKDFTIGRQLDEYFLSYLRLCAQSSTLSIDQ